MPPSFSYLDKQLINQWSRQDFLKYYADQGQHFSSDQWIKSLRAITSGPGWYQDEQDMARELLKDHQVSDGDPSPVVVNGSVINEANINTLISQPFDATPSHGAPQTKIIVPRKVQKRIFIPQTSPKFLKDFSRIYWAMTPKKEWLLPSGDFVEDVIYQSFFQYKSQCAVHSWVIDTSDISVQGCFTPEEWAFNCSAISPLPYPDNWLVNYAASYNKFRTIDQLRKHIICNPAISAEDYDSLNVDEQRGRIWLRDSIRRWCDQFGFPSDPSTFSMAHNESWYICNVWETIYDQCMKTIAGSYMSCVESMSLSVSNRSNSYTMDRTSKKRKAVGLLDSSEWRDDTLKVVNVLNKMFCNMQSNAAGTPGADKLQTVEIVIAGWQWQLLRVCRGGGHIALLVGDRIRRVPDTFDHLVEYLDLLTLLWAFRCISGPGGTILNLTKSLTEEELRKRLKLISKN